VAVPAVAVAVAPVLAEAQVLEADLAPLAARLWPPAFNL
jgi:hypothetical protein